MSTLVEVPRCQHVSDSPWGLAQCVLPLDHEERHAYDPRESDYYIPSEEARS